MFKKTEIGGYPRYWLPAVALVFFFWGTLTVFAGDATVTVTLEEQSLKAEIKEKLNHIKQEVKRRNGSYEVGYSSAMERPIHELCGLVEPPNWRRNAPFVQMNLLADSALPSFFDWRSLNGVSAVKNQEGCGSCWAFATTAVLESQIKMICNVEEDLSEQFLVSCNRSGWSCSGGWWAHDYHIDTLASNQTDTGAVLEAASPYTAGNGTCAGPYTHPYKAASRSFIGGNSVPSVQAIKQAIFSSGPVGAAVCVGSGFQGYRSGIFNTDESGACDGSVNHAVVLVGWVDDVGPDNGYWIMKNSWGTGWGESGYMNIRYGVSNIGYSANFVDFFDCGDVAPPTESKLDCSHPVDLSTGQAYWGTTAGAASTASTYKGVALDESGPEVVHRVVTASAGDLRASLTNLTADLDVFILSACDPNSVVAFGESTAVYSNAPAGTYLVVVDGKSGASGNYTLTVDSLINLADLTGAWTSFASSSRGRKVTGKLALKNSGNANAAPFYISFYLSDDGVTIGRFLKTVGINSTLKPSQVVSLSLTYTSFSSISGKYLVAVVDSANKVIESNESNNTVYSPKVTAKYKRLSR